MRYRHAASGLSRVRYDDGESAKGVGSDHVRPRVPGSSAERLSVGAAVEAHWPPRRDGYEPNWEMGEGADTAWHAARIEAVSDGGEPRRYDLQFDDGGSAKNSLGYGHWRGHAASSWRCGRATSAKPSRTAK